MTDFEKGERVYLPDFLNDETGVRQPYGKPYFILRECGRQKVTLVEDIHSGKDRKKRDAHVTEIYKHEPDAAEAAKELRGGP